jgi:hypothetical protein
MSSLTFEAEEKRIQSSLRTSHCCDFYFTTDPEQVSIAVTRINRNEDGLNSAVLCMVIVDYFSAPR